MAVDTSIPTMTSPPAMIPLSAAPAVTVKPDPARQPSLDPAAASPYTPLSLQPVDPGVGLSRALPQQQEPSPLGAVSRGGAIAYMLDKAFRGVVAGHDAAIADKTAQFNKKLVAQQGLHNIAAQNYFDLLQSGQGIERAADGSPVVGPDGMAVLNDQGKAAQNQVKASLEALQDSVNQRFPPPKKSTKQTSSGPDGQQGSGSLISRIANHKNDPNDALTATIQGAQVAYQQRASQLLNPAYQSKISQAAGTAADTATSHANTAQLQADLSGKEAQFARMEPGPDRDQLGQQINDIKEAMQALPKESSTTKLYMSADGKDAGWYVPGHQPAGYQAKLPGSSPQVGSLSDFTKALYGPNPSPAEIIDAKNKYTPQVQTAGQHVVLVTQKDGSQLPMVVETTSASSRQAGGGAGLPTTRADQAGGGGQAGGGQAITTSVQPQLSPALHKVGQNFPALQKYLGDVVVQPGTTSATDDRQSEFYPPWESENPVPGKLTVQPYRKELSSGDGLTSTVQGELLHYIGGVNPSTGQPVDPAYHALKEQVAAARTPMQRAIDERAYNDAKKNGETRPFDQWFNQSRLDEYIMGYVNPDKADEWRKNGFYNSPDMKKAVEAVKQYLTKPQPAMSAPAAAMPATAIPATAHPRVGGAGVVSVGTQPVGGKLTPDQTKELETATTNRDQARTALNLLRQSMRERAAGQNVSLNDNDLVLGWNRAHTQRFNEQEINKINSLGGAIMKLEGGLAKIESGQLSDAQRMLFARNLTDELKVQQANVDRVRRQAGLPPEQGPAAPQPASQQQPQQPAASHKTLDDEIMQSLGH